jgi:hypothetical protein
MGRQIDFSAKFLHYHRNRVFCVGINSFNQNKNVYVVVLLDAGRCGMHLGVFVYG